MLQNAQMVSIHDVHLKGTSIKQNLIRGDPLRGFRAPASGFRQTRNRSPWSQQLSESNPVFSELQVGETFPRSTSPLSLRVPRLAFQWSLRQTLQISLVWLPRSRGTPHVKVPARNLAAGRRRFRAGSSGSRSPNATPDVNTNHESHGWHESESRNTVRSLSIFAPARFTTA
jgi:hypothetical protein